MIEASAAEGPRAHPVWKPIDILWTLMGAAGLTAVGALILVLVFPRDAGRVPAALLALVGLLIYASLFASGWFFALKRRGATLRDAGFVRVPLRVLLLMIPVTIGMMILQAVVLAVSASLLGPAPSAEQQLGVDGISLSSLDLVLLLALGAVAAPLLEEFFFRGLLLRWLSPRMSWALAAAISALLFAAVHLVPALIPALSVMGLVTAWVARRWGSIVPAIAVHALNNALVIWVVYSTLQSS